MWMIVFFMGYSVLLPDDASGQESFPVAPAIVVNLTLESEDGSYVDSRQVRKCARAWPRLVEVIKTGSLLS